MMYIFLKLYIFITQAGNNFKFSSKLICHFLTISSVINFPSGLCSTLGKHFFNASKALLY